MALADHLIVECLGLFLLTIGFIGTVTQLFILLVTRYYRRTPCIFYFVIATIHECGYFIAVIGPIVMSTVLNIDMKRLSVVWCKLRYFFALSFGTIPVTCACLATIDQLLITSQNVRLREWSNIKVARRTSAIIVIFWWLHATLWLYFQDMSPITQACVYRTNAFFAYTIIFGVVIICLAHCIIMMIFGILTFRNIQAIAILSRLGFDRQLTIIVFVQIGLTLIGLSPYGIYCIYLIFTMNVEKDADRQMKEQIVSSCTYLFTSVTYGSRFYLFLLVSTRFRRLVNDRICFWRQRRIYPMVQ